MPKGNMLISAVEIVRKYRLSYQTLNYYTSMGLFSVAKKASNHRLYDESAIRQRLKRIKVLKESGYPLQLIRQILSSKGRRRLR